MVRSGDPSRYCPFCGEIVPSNSVTCPKCYRKIPSEPIVDKVEGNGTEKRDDGNISGYNRNVALILALIPGLFGFVGLGQIYRDHRKTGHYIFTLVGLLIFILVIMLLSNGGHGVALGILSTLGAFPLMLIYALMYIAALADVLIRSVFRLDLHF